MKSKQWILILMVVVVLGLVGCTRSASDAPTAVPGAETPQVTEQQPPSNLETAVAGGGFATQTAEAANPGQGEQEQGETPEAPTEPPTTGEEPTAVSEPTEPAAEPTPVPPTATQATAAGGGCTSPYTVQSGEWVWSIGRKCNISPQAIIDANNLACYYDFAGRLQCPVYSGTQLILPANAPPFVGP